mmetsp:Transcript_8598/g.7624  ORF Transcript_8598/g.7624 Transcript_8598/m.7624 type:complete len:224 (+) Transcript_8598:1036-1707(+)
MMEERDGVVCGIGKKYFNKMNFLTSDPASAIKLSAFNTLKTHRDDKKLFKHHLTNLNNFLTNPSLSFAFKKWKSKIENFRNLRNTIRSEIQDLNISQYKNIKSQIKINYAVQQDMNILQKDSKSIQNSINPIKKLAMRYLNKNIQKSLKSYFCKWKSYTLTSNIIYSDEKINELQRTIQCYNDRIEMMEIRKEQYLDKLEQFKELELVVSTIIREINMNKVKL